VTSRALSHNPGTSSILGVKRGKKKTLVSANNSASGRWGKHIWEGRSRRVQYARGIELIKKKKKKEGKRE